MQPFILFDQIHLLTLVLTYGVIAIGQGVGWCIASYSCGDAGVQCLQLPISLARSDTASYV